MTFFMTINSFIFTLNSDHCSENILFIKNIYIYTHYLYQLALTFNYLMWTNNKIKIAFVYQGHIKWIKSASKVIYNVTKYLYFK